MSDPTTDRTAATGFRDAVRATFDDWARSDRADGMEQGHRDVVLQMLDRAGLQAEDHVLDVGCGSGWTVRLMAGIVGKGRAFGVDLSEAMIEHARGLPHPANAAFTAAPVDGLPFADASLHCIVSMETIYYWPDIEAGLREIHRVLRPGGRFLSALEYYAENPYTAVWSEAMDLDLRRLGAADYEELLRKCGFAGVASEQLVDRRPPKPEADFQASECFPSFDDYLKYREIGALLILGSKPEA